jgi:D-alanine-D-alanine ligase
MRISVIMGGPSAEHEVSLASGREICANLDREKYQIAAVVVSRSKEFYFCDATQVAPSLDELASPGQCAKFLGPLAASQSRQLWEQTDVALLGLHGEFGEDGLIQGYLDTVGVCYTGSDIFASAVGMNKIASKILLESARLTTPPSLLYGPLHPSATPDTIIEKLGLPCFVKCPQSGSSRLMGMADDREKLEQLCSSLLQNCSDLLVEKAVSGDEYSCPVLEYPDGSLKTLPPVLIKPAASSFFDYTAKYTEGASEEIVPAPCSRKLTEQLQEAAKIAHTTLGCSGLSRTDMIVENDTLYVLEINTLPGLTPASLAPKSFAAQGGTYSQLLDILIDTARKKIK